MSNEEKNIGAESGQTSTPQNTQPPKKKGVHTAALVCAIIFIVLYAVVNIASFSQILSRLMSVLTPIILGFGLALLLNPLLKLFERRVFGKVKNKSVVRVLSMLLTYLSVILLLVAFGFLVIPQLIESIKNFAQNFNGYLNSTIETINRFLSDFVGKTHTEDIIDSESVMAAISRILSDSGDLFGGVMNYVVQYGMGLVVGLKNILFAIFISIYVLASKERLKAQVNKATTALLSNKEKRRFYRYVRLCNKTFGGFFIGKLIDSLIISILTLVVMLIFRMPVPLLIATIVGITNIVPVFGPIIGAVPCFFLIFIVSPSKALIFLVLILLIQQLDGNVIGPKILGNTTGISTLGVVISIIIMGDFFGLVGMILGVPLFALVIAICKEFMEYRLRKKGLPTNTAEYYATDSLVDPHEDHESVSAKMFKNIGAFCMKIVRLFCKKKEKKEKQEKESENHE